MKTIAVVLWLLVGIPAVAQEPVIISGSATFVGPINYCGADSGSGNSFVCQTTSVSARQLKRLAAGNNFRFLATHGNSGASTLAIDGMTGVTIKKMANGALSDLVSGDITSGQMVEVVYDGTYFQFKAAAGGGSTSSITIQHTFSAAGTFNYAHNLGTSYPGQTCYVTSGASSYTSNTVDANHVAITATGAAVIVCTFYGAGAATIQ